MTPRTWGSCRAGTAGAWAGRRRRCDLGDRFALAVLPEGDGAAGGAGHGGVAQLGNERLAGGERVVVARDGPEARFAVAVGDHHGDVARRFQAEATEGRARLVDGDGEREGEGAAE